MNISELKQKIQDFVSENTRVTIAIAVILVLLAVLGFVLGAVQDASKPKKKPAVKVPDQINYEITGDFFAPKVSPLVEEYYFSREQSSRWMDKEFDRWFVVPDGKSLDKLGRSNDRIVDDILGDAP